MLLSAWHAADNDAAKSVAHATNLAKGSQNGQRTVKLRTFNGGADMLATDTTKQILIVDRDVAAVEPLRMKLSEAGFIVRAITDGAAAVAALAERPPHLVIVDWNMPGFAGLELIQGVRRARTPNTMRLIILSALSAEQDVVTGLNLGADDYIAKPFSLREVVARVSVILRARRGEQQRAALTLRRAGARCRDEPRDSAWPTFESAWRRISTARVPHDAPRAHVQSQPTPRTGLGR